VEVDATPPSPAGSVSVEISSDVTLGGDHIAGLDAKQVEDKVVLFAATGTMINPQKWVKSINLKLVRISSS